MAEGNEGMEGNKYGKGFGNGDGMLEDGNEEVASEKWTEMERGQWGRQRQMLKKECRRGIQVRGVMEEESGIERGVVNALDVRESEKRQLE